MEPNEITQLFSTALIGLKERLELIRTGDPMNGAIVLNQLKMIVLQAQSRLNESLVLIQNAEMFTDKNQQQIIQQTQQGIQNNIENLGQEAMADNIKSRKVFNIKKAQGGYGHNPGTMTAPPLDMDTMETPSVLDFSQQTDNLPPPPDINSVGIDEQERFERASSLSDFLREMDQVEATQFLLAHFSENDPGAEKINSMVEQFYNVPAEAVDSLNQQDQIAQLIFDSLPDDLKQTPSNTIRAVQRVQSSGKEIEKIAKEVVEKQKVIQPFNLRKTAQHKTQENVIMYGPDQRRIDPFYRQPVSDWSIIERNKGFGLVVDDVWDIDYEAIWRGSIMDKYSRPYRDKDGNWIGGYIQKRFEVDKNIPTTNNYQLKPGQLRKPVLPEYGLIESRLQNARATGQIEGSTDKSKPFNWKEAQFKKKS